MVEVEDQEDLLDVVGGVEKQEDTVGDLEDGVREYRRLLPVRTVGRRRRPPPVVRPVPVVWDDNTPVVDGDGGAESA